LENQGWVKDQNERYAATYSCPLEEKKGSNGRWKKWDKGYGIRAMRWQLGGIKNM
jgi:hypothetical protein